MDGGDGRAADRVHVVVLTREAQYHLVGRTCVGVRMRATGDWLRDHEAVGAQLRGCRPLDGGELWPGALRVGAAVELELAMELDPPQGPLGSGPRLFTSDEVFAIEHPGPDDSERSLAAARGDDQVLGGRRRKRDRLAGLATIAALLPWLGPER